MTEKFDSHLEARCTNLYGMGKPKESARRNRQYLASIGLESGVARASLILLNKEKHNDTKR